MANHAPYCRCADCIDAENRVTPDSVRGSAPVDTSAAERDDETLNLAADIRQLIESAPERIWLDLGENLEALNADATFRDLSEVTWSEDNATGCGIKYIRSDAAPADPGAVAEQVRVAPGGYVQDLINWAAERWHAEVKHRPMINIHRRTLDTTWRQVLRHLGVDDRARLGPTHDDLRAEITTKEWERMNGAALASSPSSAPAESGWVAFADREPPQFPAVDDPSVMLSPRVLVTNNIDARDRAGRMSHVWFEHAIKGEDEWVAFDSSYRKIHGLSHWLDPFAAPQAVQAGGEGGNG